MDAVVTLAEVRTSTTRNGNVRYVARDEAGQEYTTFREDIGERARRLAGQRVRIAYHEDRRGQYANVYLDKVEPAQPEPEPGPDGCARPEPADAAWRTAVEAAPWLVGEPTGEVPADELYRKLKPFEERVAADIEDGRQPGA
jgi:hypothetical protein